MASRCCAPCGKLLFNRRVSRDITEETDEKVWAASGTKVKLVVKERWITNNTSRHSRGDKSQRRFFRNERKAPEISYGGEEEGEGIVKVL